MTIQTQHQDASKTVLLIGATGSLGSMIARELLAQGANLRLLVRSNSRSKLDAEVAAKSEVVDDRAGIFDGVHTVVSAVQGGTGTIVDAQLEWLQAARDAGVRRFIASDYGMNLFGLDDGENIHSDFRREFARRAEAEREEVELVHLLNGAFLDRGVLFGFLGAFDLDKGEAYLWGDGEAKMEVTTFADTAAYAAAAAADDRPVPDKVYVAGNVLTFDELVAETEAGLDRILTVKKLGTLADMDAEIDRRQADGQGGFSAVPLMYWRAMLSGKGKLGPLMNDRYPWVQPTSVRDYAAAMAAGTV
ncbi:NmrA family NAD(P)-binding protein [Pseudarthrobacter albicanus]|uniref:NmrA family NAD(P)-binding protein n=1 Tax=Pseudarthrobacter albicanus TaxID=2823873 RepID=UPI001BABE7FE|nr:NmrA family NAD(P)-binding protein [Pseudarthrobacter albicanus]